MKAKTVLAIILLGTIILNAHWISKRIISWDEGFHLYVANQISQGEQIYADFFYPQLPLFPHLLAPLSSPGFSTLFLWRNIAAGIGFLLGLLILWYGTRISNLKTAIFAFFLYTVNGTILGWHTVVHPGSFAEFSAFLSFLLLIYGIKKGGALRFFISGLALSVAISLRIIYIPVIGIWIYLIYRERSFKEVFQFLAGFVLIALFTLYFLIQNGETFIFQTLTFHLIRGRIWTNLTGLGSIWAQKGGALCKFFVLPQTLVIFSFLGFALFRYLTSKKSLYFREFALICVAFTIFLGHLILVPVHFFYFVQSLPFLIAALIPYLEGWLRRSSRKLISFAVVIYGVGVVFPYLIYVSGWRERDAWKKIENLRETVETIESLSDEDDHIVSLNPNYLYLSKRRGSGLQPWLLGISSGLDEEQRKRYRIPGQEKMKLYIETKRPKLVVGDMGWDPPYYRRVILPWVTIYVKEGP